MYARILYTPVSKDLCGSGYSVGQQITNNGDLLVATRLVLLAGSSTKVNSHTTHQYQMCTAKISKQMNTKTMEKGGSGERTSKKGYAQEHLSHFTAHLGNSGIVESHSGIPQLCVSVGTAQYREVRRYRGGALTTCNISTTTFTTTKHKNIESPCS